MNGGRFGSLLGWLVLTTAVMAQPQQFPAPPLVLPEASLLRQTPSLPETVPTEPRQLPEAQPQPPLLASSPPIEATRPPGQFWASAEFLMWFVAPGKLPLPLLTTGTATINPASPGVVQGMGTQVLFDDELDYGTFRGLRGSLGFWFTRDQILGLELIGTYTQPHDVEVHVPGHTTSTGVLLRPFLDAQTQTATAALVAFATPPNNVTGFATITSDSRLSGAELHLVGKFLRETHTDWDVFLGARYLRLHENLEITTMSQAQLPGALTFLGNPVPLNGIIQVMDHFATRNEFWGVQLGTRQVCQLGYLILAGTCTIAVGQNRQTITILGNTTQDPGLASAATAPGGVFAVGSNSGVFRADQFCIVPQLQLSIGYQCSEGLRIFVHYDFLAWTGVVRPGDQMDPVINRTQVPTSPSFGPLTGPPRPIVPFQEQLFWVQGIGLGMEMRY